MAATRVVVADDHTLMRLGIRSVLAACADIEIAGEAANGQEALRLVESLEPEVLLTDLSMEGMSGLELIARVASAHPRTRIIVLSMHAAKEYVTRALKAGASGYLLKDQTSNEVEHAIRAVLRGETYLCPAVSGPIVEDYVRQTGGPESEGDRLTARQTEILTLITRGSTTKAIAHRLGLSVKTIEAHRAQIMERLGIYDVAGLVRYAIRTGLITPDE